MELSTATVSFVLAVLESTGLGGECSLKTKIFSPTSLNKVSYCGVFWNIPAPTPTSLHHISIMYRHRWSSANWVSDITSSIKLEQFVWAIFFTCDFFRNASVYLSAIHFHIFWCKNLETILLPRESVHQKVKCLRGVTNLLRSQVR